MAGPGRRSCRSATLEMPPFPGPVRVEIRESDPLPTLRTGDMKALVLPGGGVAEPRADHRVAPPRPVHIANRPLLDYVLDTIRDIGVTDIALAEPGERDVLSAIAAAREFLGDDDFLLYSGEHLLADGIAAAAAEFRARRPAAEGDRHGGPAADRA